MIATLDELIVALEKAPMGVLVLKAGRIAWLNERLLELIGQAKAAWIARPLAETPLARWQDELVKITTDAGPRWLKRYCIEPFEEGEVLYFLDVTEQVAIQETVSALRTQLQSLETTDPATGLKNRRAILKELDRQISRSRRYENPLSVIRLTVETNGAPEYQRELMRSISQTLKDKLRWADEVGMLEPNTFLVVLPETLLDDAKELAVKLLGDRAAFRFKDGEGKVRYGVAAWHKGDDLRKLLRRVQQDQQIDLSALLS
ncbi:MAG: GGDEF domain-containing protein [Methylohalobius sp.]